MEDQPERLAGLIAGFVREPGGGGLSYSVAGSTGNVGGHRRLVRGRSALRRGRSLRRGRPVIGNHRGSFARNAPGVLRADDHRPPVLEAVDGADLLALPDDALAGLDIDLVHDIVGSGGDRGAGRNRLLVGEELGQIERRERRDQEPDGEDDAEVEEVDEAVERVSSPVDVPAGAMADRQDDSPCRGTEGDDSEGVSAVRVAGSAGFSAL